MAFRTKKISQMDPKGSNLASTDLLEISELVSGSYVTKSITGAEIISGATTGFVPTSRTLTINGTTQDLSADRTFTISTGITIGTTAITSGTVGRVLFEGTGNVVQESANLFWDNTNGRLGIGTSSPTKALHVNGNTFIQTVSNSDDGLIISNQGNIAFAGTTNVIGARFRGIASAFQLSDAAYNIKFVFNMSANLSYFNGGGNVAIGTTTDAGYKLDVNGTARVQNQLTTTGSINASGAIARGTYLNQTLVATANNDILVGLDIAPTFTNGAFTGVTNLSIRTSGLIASNNGGFYGGFVVNSQRLATSSYNHSFVSHSPNSAVPNNIYAGTRPATPTTTAVEHYLGTDNQIYWNTANASYNFLVNGTQHFRLNSVGQVLIQNGGTYTDEASSRLTVNSTTQGVLFPRMTTTQKNAIASPATGLQIYDSTLNRPCFYNGTTWITL